MKRASIRREAKPDGPKKCEGLAGVDQMGG